MQTGSTRSRAGAFIFWCSFSLTVWSAKHRLNILIKAQAVSQSLNFLSLLLLSLFWQPLASSLTQAFNNELIIRQLLTQQALQSGLFRRMLRQRACTRCQQKQRTRFVLRPTLAVIEALQGYPQVHILIRVSQALAPHQEVFLWREAPIMALRLPIMSVQESPHNCRLKAEQVDADTDNRDACC